MKTDPQDTSLASGYLMDGFEGVSERFTQLTTVSTRDHNTLTKGKRYGRWYLLKSLNADVAGQAAYQEMLTKEFELTMRAQHPGVVQAIGMEDVPTLGRCIVMEWIEGQDLSQWLDGGTTRDERLRVVNQLLDTIAYLHALGIAHRDLKPSNIMITHNGKQVKVIDFGLADTDTHAVFKQPAGTERYMAPEQASSAVADVRNDIYSLGVIMRQMDLGRVYNRAAARCLRPIDERYQSIASLQHDLQRWRTVQRWVRNGAIAFPVVAGLVALWMMSRPASVADNSHLVDSLRHELVANNERLQASNAAQQQMEASMQKRMTTLNDSLSILATSNQQFQQEKEDRVARQRRIDAAIAEGIRRVDAANAKIHLKEHLDTAVRSGFNSMWVDWHSLSLRGRNEANKYLQSIRGQFDIKEMAEIEFAVKEHCSRYEAMINGIVDQPANP